MRRVKAASLVPQHIGIIMDGNRRWATAKGLPALAGYQYGKQALEKVTRLAMARGVKYISVYAFSTENWARPANEVQYLMRLFGGILKGGLKELATRGVRIRFLGSLNNLPAELITKIHSAEAATARNRRLTLGLCLNYGGQTEIVEAVNRLLNKQAAPQAVTTQGLADELYGPEIPPLDLVIRTSGERRLSNFMLWRAAYAELAFVDKHWPDFGAADFDAVLSDYASRKRRFGR